MTEHPITPPPELVQQWYDNMGPDPGPFESFAIAAARWGADQQLAEDAKWLDHNALNEAHLKTIPVGNLLKEAMRPKPLSLKEQALALLNDWCEQENGPGESIICNGLHVLTIRRALEQLND